MRIDVTQKSNGHDEVQLVFNQSVSYKSLQLNAPPREVLDFINSSQASNYALNLKKAHFIKAIRQARDRTGTLRVVIDLSQADLAVKHTRPSKNTLTIDISSKAQSQKRDKGSSWSVGPLTPKEVIVVLDPGHGGKDPGAQGASGTKEKDVVLKIAKVLQSDLNRQRGVKAYLTRESDRYISLRRRLEIAREKNADLFVSIHADAFINNKSRGASVFALSPKGATSEAARWLAEKENYSELGGVDLGKLQDSSGVIRSVLIDLSQTATIRASLLLGRLVLDKLDDLTVLHHNKVEQAQFVVLKSPDIPSILIETGFITNPREEKNLNSPWYHRQLSKAVVQGILFYFNQYPPRGTYFSKRERIYEVKPGDNLSSIAKRKAISLKKLLSYNNLQLSSRLSIGQRLKIP